MFSKPSMHRFMLELTDRIWTHRQNKSIGVIRMDDSQPPIDVLNLLDVRIGAEDLGCYSFNALNDLSVIMV